VKNLDSLSMRLTDDQLYIQDQQLLPHTEEWIKVTDIEHMVEIIKALKVRGAPAIGVSAALALAQYSLHEPDLSKIEKAAQDLRKSRPTAVNLMICIDRLLAFLKQDSDLDNFRAEAIKIFEEDVELCQRMGEHGASLIEDGDGILTHCNTGGLATAGVGTALGAIRIFVILRVSILVKCQQALDFSGFFRR